jgi:hypothetical protein
MKKAVLFLLIVVSAQPPAPTTELFYDRVVAFEHHWDIFIRKLAGCPLKVTLTETEQCNPNLGQLDRNSFRKARHAAAELFQLEEPKVE